MAAAASAALTMKPIRAAYSFDGTHSDTYYDETAISYGIDFFDITLRGGQASIDPAEQVWHGRAACGLLGPAPTLAAFVALALTLLHLPFFATIVRPEAESMTTVGDGKGVLKYVVLYIIFLLPAPLLYYWLIGYPYYMQPQWFKFLTKFMPNSFFNMAPMNSLMLFNCVMGVIFLALYLLVFFFIAKKSGFGFENTGLKLPVVQILKSFLLAAVSFLGVYAVVYLCHAVTGTCFSFFKFNIMPMNAEHWVAFFKYLPVWLVFFGGGHLQLPDPHQQRPRLGQLPLDRPGILRRPGGDVRLRLWHAVRHRRAGHPVYPRHYLRTVGLRRRDVLPHGPGRHHAL